MKPVLLIVDDNEAILRLLYSVFSRHFTVFAAADGVDAMSRLAHGIRPELIVCDLQMQNIDGNEFATHLYTSQLHQRIPVILLSDSPEDMDPPFTPNVAGVIRKPFDPIFLLDSVRQMLAVSKNANERLLFQGKGNFFITSKL